MSLHLSEPQDRALWHLGQHKYGWGYIISRQRRTYASLERKGLVLRSASREDAFQLSADGLYEVAQRWPTAPAVIQSYEGANA